MKGHCPVTNSGGEERGSERQGGWPVGERQQDIAVSRAVGKRERERGKVAVWPAGERQQDELNSEVERGREFRARHFVL